MALDSLRSLGLNADVTVIDLGDDAVLRSFLSREVKQNRLHARVGQVGGDLRAHHAGTQHGDFSDMHIGLAHFVLLLR